MIKYVRFFLILFIFIMFGFGFKNLANLYSADLLAEKASELFNDGEYVQSFQLSNRAINKNPLEPRYYTARAKTLLALTAGETESNILSYKLLALEDLRNAQKLNPHNLLTIKGTISSYYFLASKDFMRPAGSDNIEATFSEITQNYYRSIWGRSPNDVGIFVLIYTYSNRLGFTEIAADARNKIIELRPDLLDWYNFD